jgi:hypothetical protein
MEIGVTEVVECPASRHHHRVGVTPTEHRSVGVGVVGECIEPEHEVLGPHPVRDGGDLRTTGAPTEPLHLFGL